MITIRRRATELKRIFLNYLLRIQEINILNDIMVKAIRVRGFSEGGDRATPFVQLNHHSRVFAVTWLLPPLIGQPLLFVGNK